jgi:hypothetical protein
METKHAVYVTYTQRETLHAWPSVVSQDPNLRSFILCGCLFIALSKNIILLKTIATHFPSARLTYKIAGFNEQCVFICMMIVWKPKEKYFHRLL